MKVTVVDGQGGGIGKSLIEKLTTYNDIEIIALGTNSYAAEQMRKAGAIHSYYEKNTILKEIESADFIIGAIGIIAPGALKGEVTPQIAQAISQSKAKKILIPLNRCSFIIVGADKTNLTEYIGRAVEMIKELC